MITITCNGNLTKDPVRVGDSLVTFGIACKEHGVKDKACFIDCKAFGKTGEVILQYCKKGSSLAITGGLTQDSWEDKQTGKKCYAHRINVNGVELMGRKPDAAKTEKQENSRSSDPSNDDIPF